MGAKRGILGTKASAFRLKHSSLPGVSPSSIRRLMNEMNFRIRKTELDARNWTWEQAAKLCDENPGFNSAELAALIREAKTL